MIQDVSKDVRYTSIGNLPSDFKPYVGEFSVLNIRQILLPELKLLSRAASTKNVAFTLKAIDQTIDVDINRLTLGDMYYVFMWHKLHSFPKTPVTLAWDCGNIVPYTEDGRFIANPSEIKPHHFDVCGKANAQIVHQTEIDILCLPDDFSGLPEGLDFPRVNLLAELLAVDDPDIEQLVRAVQWIKEGETLADKFKYLESLPDISLYSEACVIDETVIHGVNQRTKIKCSQCQASSAPLLDLDPVNFFRKN